MEDIRGSLSKMKKKLNHRLTGRKRKQDGTGADPSREGTDSTGSFPQPELPVVADESCDREGDRASAVGEPVFSTDRPPQPDGPESVPAHGSDYSQQGGEADIDGREVGQRQLHPHPDVKVAVGEVEEVYPSSSTPLISHGGKPDST